MQEQTRLNKYLAQCGVCSRREADKLIEQGRVLVNGIPGTTGQQVSTADRIHVNGNFLIGTYDTMEEAAIAYNKAIDILKRNGSKKQYTQNYVETVSAGMYADIYTRLPISQKIYSLTFPNNQ